MLVDHVYSFSFFLSFFSEQWTSKRLTWQQFFLLNVILNFATRYRRELICSWRIAMCPLEASFLFFICVICVIRPCSFITPAIGIWQVNLSNRTLSSFCEWIFITTTSPLIIIIIIIIIIIASCYSYRQCILFSVFLLTLPQVRLK